MPEYKITTVFKLKKYVVKEYQRLNALNFNLKGPISDQAIKMITKNHTIYRHIQTYLNFIVSENTITYIFVKEPSISTERKVSIQ